MQPHHSSTEEVQWQEQVARTFDYFEGVCAAAAEYSLGIVKRHLVGKRILEVGPADGYMTRGLVQDFDLTLVEPSETLCHKLRRCFPRAQVISTLVEDFIPSERIDDVLLCHVLDHVRDPEQVVRMAGTWLSPGGKIIAIAPNSESLHRQAAVRMGLLPAVNAFSERDQIQGKRRIFNREEFRRLFLIAGLEIESFGGYWLKPISNHQIEQQWTPEMIDAFFALGECYPEIAAEMFLVARQR
ncbi:MAG: class I SAM-dependent methyltransferase [Terriglobales bacterium]|jgi:2-polyprenyl-3-methyl-5-hydroxy-6-metoxy-1,4-benzoquinol methylase